MNSPHIPTFHIEPADYTADFNDLRAVREPVFVIEQNVPLEEEWDALDPTCRHVIARDSTNRPIGTGRLTPEGKIGRMAVLREWRGLGVGEALLRTLIEQARALGWPEVTLNSQVNAIGFYEKFDFQSFGELYEDTGIMHRQMRLILEPLGSNEIPWTARPSVQAVEFTDLETVIQASLHIIANARRELIIYSYDLEPALYSRPDIIEAFKHFAITSQGGVARWLVQNPVLAQQHIPPLLILTQRLPSAFAFRAPEEPEDLHYSSIYLANDRDGYLFCLNKDRFEGHWSPTLPSRSRQIHELFNRVWERSRPCTEFRALEL